MFLLDSSPLPESQERGKVVISHPLGREFVSRLRAVDDTVVPHELPELDALESLVQVGRAGSVFVLDWCDARNMRWCVCVCVHFPLFPRCLASVMRRPVLGCVVGRWFRGTLSLF